MDATIPTAPAVPAAADLLSDCRLMLRYARKNAIDLSANIVRDVARLDAALVRLKLAPLSDIDQTLIAAGGDVALPAAEAEAASNSERVLRVHEELSKVIAPATALSLQTSEPPPGRHRFLGGMPLVVKAAALAALVNAIIFVVSAAGLAQQAASSGSAATGPTASVANGSKP
jgi:hypothetical protein